MPGSTRAVALAEVTRRDVASGREVVESTHTGHVVVVDGDGALVWAAGDAQRTTFVRSSVKVFQATACLELLEAHGWPGGRPAQDEIAVGWASHAAEDVHLDTVRRLLQRSGLEPEALTCPPAARPDAPGDGLRRLHHNCSGKHALFGLAGRTLDVHGAALLDPAGPFQSRILAALRDALGEFVALGVDGCGAPAVAVPLQRLAGGIVRTLTEDRWAAARDAGLEHGVLVGGSRRLETALLGAGVVAKPGAEGVFVAAWRDGSGTPLGLAVKVEDGASRAADEAARAVLASFGAPAVPGWEPEPPLGGGRPAGVIRPLLRLDLV